MTADTLDAVGAAELKAQRKRMQPIQQVLRRPRAASEHVFGARFRTTGADWNLHGMWIMTDSALRAGDAFLVVDVQRDFRSGGALEVPQGDEILPVVNGTLEADAS